MLLKKQGAPSTDLIGPQISDADMNSLREIQPRNIMDEPPRSEYADDYDLLNNQQGSAEAEEEVRLFIRQRRLLS